MAELAAQAGATLGLPAADVVMLRRAALVHDIGMIGIPSGVWEEPGEWSISQRERARTHPYLTERMLARTPLLAEVGALRVAAPRAAGRLRLPARAAG